MIEPTVVPEAFDDYRSFLRAWLVERRPRISQARLARALGRSPAWLSLVLNGERSLPPSVVGLVGGALGLSEEHSRSLAALVDLESDVLAIRRGARAWLDTVRRFNRAEALDDGHAALFVPWWNPAILELARCVDLPEDPTRVAAAFDPPLDPADAASALRTLESLGLLVRDHRGVLVPADASVASPVEVPPGILSDVMALWHGSALARGQEAIHTAPGEERHHASLMFALPEAEIEALRGRLQEFEKELLAWCEARGGKGDRVYQLTFALFPVSRSAIGPTRTGGGSSPRENR